MSAKMIFAHGELHIILKLRNLEIREIRFFSFIENKILFNSLIIDLKNLDCLIDIKWRYLKILAG